MRLLLLLCGLLLSGIVSAQTDRLSDALRLKNTGDLPAAAALLDSLYQRQPADAEIYHSYFSLLLEMRNYKTAEKLATERRDRERNSPLPFVDMGLVMRQSGREKRATEIWTQAVAFVNGDDFITNALATAFTNAGEPQWALQVYEKAAVLTQNRVVYAAAMARLYAQSGNTEGAVTALLDAVPMQLKPAEEIKASLLEILGNDNRKNQLAVKAVIKRIQAEPENALYADLLTWLYTRRDDWEGALLQVRAIDERGREGGRSLLQFARMARAEKQYDIAYETLGIIAENGNPAIQQYAAAERLYTGMQKLDGQPIPDKAFADTLAAAFEQHQARYGAEVPAAITRTQARLEALYRGNAARAADLLEKMLASNNNTDRKDAGQARLDLGDYQLLMGRVWDATLTYSQVDKAFREDALGEEARFRNAKLAWYRGDFKWAQNQLSVLKASTSELIANDALALSVLITENTPTDSNETPLKCFAAADLLLFQNKQEVANQLLDSVAKAFPENALQDDILLKRSQILVRQQKYPEALALLEKIVKDYGTDVLADDALYQEGVIYETYLQQPAKAKEAYERLLIDYPGSTLVAEVRKKANAL